MDWLQFVSSIISAIVWPSVVAYLLYLLRHHLGALASRLEKLTLPGGSEAVFREEINATSKRIEVAVEKSSVISLDKIDYNRDAIEPKEKIEHEFAELEQKMSRVISELPVGDRRTPSDFIFYVLDPIAKDYPIYKVYTDIRNIYFAMTARNNTNVSYGDAEDFRRMCELFFSSFRIQFEEYKKQVEVN